MSKIGLVTANTWYQMSFMQFRRSHAYQTLARQGLEDMGAVKEADPVLARVIRGRWVIVCPDCGNMEYAWEENFFMCFKCFNASKYHRWRPTIFPDKRSEIENILLKRCLANRNWQSGETIEDLQRENEEHSDELLIRG